MCQKTCGRCGTALTGKQTKWCSTKCGTAANQAAWREKNPIYHRWDAWKRTGGEASMEDYAEVIFFRSCCEGCGVYIHNDTDKRVDHNHATGEIRGMLCDICNTTEGKFDSDPEKLRGLLNYMERNQ